MKPWWAGMLATLGLLASLSSPARAAWPLGMLDATPAFEVAIGDHLIDGDTGGLIAQPGQTLDVTAIGLGPHSDPTLDLPGALHAVRLGHDRWRLKIGRAPGVYSIAVRDRATGEALPVSVFVPEAFDARHRQIDGYRIGHYQAARRDGRAIYDPPTALLRVDRGDIDAPLSPDFTIGQFLCHQQPRQWPKFALVRPLLVAKLEAILHALQERGIDADTLTVMSGYRTPHYNAKIGNTTVYSRHLYGGAADIFVDTNHDGEMDDLNGDGRIDIGDARWLARFLANLDRQNPRFVGGLSAYPATAYHGPFVHIDVRGTAVRW